MLFFMIVATCVLALDMQYASKKFKGTILIVLFIFALIGEYFSASISNKEIMKEIQTIKQHLQIEE